VSDPGATLEYPPAEHILRDLRLAVEHRPDGTSTAWIPASEHVCHASGVPRAGVLSILVDVVGGGLAAMAVRPDWIATADLTLHLTPRTVAGEIRAHGAVRRRGRTTVVAEVTLDAIDAGGTPVPLGLATMSFAVLPRRDTNLVIDQVDVVTRSTMATETSGLTTAFPDRIQLTVVEAGAGVVEVPLDDYIRNSLGAIQGGVMAATAAAGAEAALGAACGRAVETVDLQVTFLALARVGPIRTRARVLESDPAYGAAHVEIVDTGAADRVTTLARVVAVAP
jgi:acyl-coenzyme A thioesterase PaaI-like protein